MLACIRAAHAPFYQRKNNHNAVCQNKIRPKFIALPPEGFFDTRCVYKTTRWESDVRMDYAP